MNTRICKRLLASLLSLTLLLGTSLIPAKAAEEEATGSSNAPMPIITSTQATGLDAETPWGNPLTVNQETKAATTKIMYAGNEWLVIGYDGSGVASTTGTMTLLEKDTPLIQVAFNYDNSNNTYKGSDLESAVNERLNSIFNPKEANAMQERTLPGGSKNNAQGGMHGEDVTAKLWPLDVAEAEALGGGVGEDSIPQTSYPWFLRSPGSDYDRVAIVNNSGVVIPAGSRADFAIAFRPAFQLKLSSVLFSSAAAGGKSGNVGEFADLKTTDNKLKLTILDDTNLMLGTVSAIKIGNQVALTYTGATEGKALSAIFADSTGAVQYAKLAETIPAGGSGTATVTLPDGFDIGTMQLTVFVEQINGDNKTDYACTPKAVSVTLAASDAGLVSVAGAAITAGSEAGTVDAPKTAAITVENSKTSIAIADIAVSAKATAHMYSDADFSTGEDAPINLAEGENHVYIKVTAEDTTALYYDVTVTRKALPPTPPTPVNPDPPSDGGNDSGSSVTPPKPAEPEISTGGGNTTATVEAPAKTTDSTTSASVSNTTVKNAIAAAEKAAATGSTVPAIQIKAEVPAGATELVMTLPKAALNSFSSSKAENMTITSGLGEITLPSATAASIAKQAGSGNVQVSLGKVDVEKSLTEAQRAAVGDAPVYDISITAGGKHITGFDGGVLTIALPYTLKPGEDPAGVVVWYVNGEGKLQKVTSTYDEKTKTVTFTTDHLSLYSVGYEAPAAVWVNPFSDVAEGAWYYDSVQYVSQKGLMSGTDAATFAPDVSMTRGMFVTVLWRLAGSPQAGEGAAFTDVPSTTYCAQAVAWASKNGIVNGIGGGSFAPNQSITREQLAVIMANYAKAMGQTLPQMLAETSFADNERISGYAKDAVKQMQQAGILSGKGGNQFDPQGTATRAEAATVLRQFAQLTTG